MSKQKLFGTKVFIKSRSVGIVTRRAKSFRGIVTASNKKAAIEIAKNQFFLEFETHVPAVFLDDIVIKKCIPYNDFVIKQK